MISRYLRLNCLKCHATQQQPIQQCDSCNQLHNVPNLDYFALFQIPMKATNPPDLKQKYRILQSISHPDRHSNNKSAERISSHVSLAYKTLLDPFLKAQYALGLRKYHISEQDHIAPELLYDIMDALDRDDTDYLMKQQSDCHAGFWCAMHKRDYEEAKSWLLQWKYVDKHLDQ